MIKNAAQQMIKLIMSPPKPAFKDIGTRVMNSKLPKEWRRKSIIPAIANAHP